MKDKIKLSILWIFSFLVIICMMTIRSYAAGTNTLPFQSNFVPAYQPLFENYPSFLTPILSHYNVDNIDNCAIFIYESSENSSSIFFRTLLVTTDNISNFVPYNEFNNVIDISNFDDFKEDYFVLPSNVNTYMWRLRKNLTECYLYSTNPVVVSNASFFGNHSLDSYNYFTYCYPIYVKGSLSLNNQLVLTSNFNVIDFGAAIEPLPFIVPEYFTGGSAPINVPPTYTSSDYTWTTPPTFDGSSVENALGSIGDLISWLSNNLKEEFKNLTDNLEGFFKYIGETIQYYGNAIIETLNNGIQTFYNNMKSLVENISNQIEYIKEPLDQDVIWTNISSTSLVTNINTITTSLNSFQSSFTGVSEPTSYTIPIHLENLPSNWFGSQTTQYIDLGVVNGTVKEGLRLFVWAMVTYGLVVTIFDSIANYINGGGDES